MGGKDIAKRIKAYRQSTFFPDRPGRLQTVEEAISFVNRRGFIFFWPIEGVALPSLWGAVAGDRPVSPEHDDPGHVTWRWKDEMLGERVWYYAKILRKRATFISLEMVPYFYALSENYGAPEEDYLLQYRQGRLAQESKNVYEALLREGRLDTLALRKAAHLWGRKSDYRFGKALAELQADFKIMPVGIAEAGAWNYAYVYDIVPRHCPEIPEKARWIGEREAKRRLLECYFNSLGAARFGEALKLFGWAKDDLRKALEDLTEDGSLRAATQAGEERRELFVLARILGQ